MENLYKVLISSFRLILFSVISLNVWAANPNAPLDGLFTVSGTGEDVIWLIDPRVKYETAVLSVSAPDGIEGSTQEFDHPETPFYQPTDDGLYTYELTLIPFIPPGLRDELKAARASAGGQDNPKAAAALHKKHKLQETIVTSGGFSIEGGALISQETEE